MVEEKKLRIPFVCISFRYLFWYYLHAIKMNKKQNTVDTHTDEIDEIDGGERLSSQKWANDTWRMFIRWFPLYVRLVVEHGDPFWW